MAEMVIAALPSESNRCRRASSAADSFIQQIDVLLPLLRRYARRLTRDAAEADDLVQETFVRGFEKSHLWRQGTDLRAWLFTILHNLYVSDIRRAVRSGTMVDLAHAELSFACPPRQAERLQIRDLERALARLPEEQRSVVVLVGVDGERYETVAALLGVPSGTVRSRLSRGRTKLRELMESAPPPHPRRSETRHRLAV